MKVKSFITTSGLLATALTTLTAKTVEAAEFNLTGNPLLDYFLLPLILTVIVFVIFKKPIISLVNKIEKTRQ